MIKIIEVTNLNELPQSWNLSKTQVIMKLFGRVFINDSQY